MKENDQSIAEMRQGPGVLNTADAGVITIWVMKAIAHVQEGDLATQSSNGDSMTIMLPLFQGSGNTQTLF